LISSAPQALKPRKRPQQRRASATLDAIFEATIQLLVKNGLSQLTTTRVAERAGVSVGTMYQYFPHKQALIYAVNERYLELLAERIEATCRECQGNRSGDMIEALIETYWKAKTDKPDVTRALYRSVVEMDNEALISAFAARTDAAVTTMLASASDNDGSDARSNTRTLVTIIFGAVRNSFERGHSGDVAEDLRRQLVIMCRGYLERHVR
jgi:AcrR family transcriptional regulator